MSALLYKKFISWSIRFFKHLKTYKHRWYILQFDNIFQPNSCKADEAEEHHGRSKISLVALFCKICNFSIRELSPLSPHTKSA